MAFVTVAVLPSLRWSSFTSPVRFSSSRSVSSTTMEFDLSKYEEMAEAPKVETPKPSVMNQRNTYEPSTMSSVMRNYIDFEKTVTNKQWITKGEYEGTHAGYEDMMRWISLRARVFYPKPNQFVFSEADKYMSRCITAQYKATACSTGEYSVRCTEGTYRGQAENARTAALAQEFRLGQRTMLQKQGDLYETRKRSSIASHGCSYEENLLSKLPMSAAALVRGQAEAMGSCPRYAGRTEDKAEAYMSKCVEKQTMMRAVPFGVYDKTCQDGSQSYLAENKRVVALSAKFRMGQTSKISQEQWKFDVSKHACINFGHMCSYEENLFNKYKSVASSMRAVNVRYS